MARYGALFTFWRESSQVVVSSRRSVARAHTISMTGQQFLPATARRATLGISLRTLAALQWAISIGVLLKLGGGRAALPAALLTAAALWLAVPATIALASFVGKWAQGDWTAAVRGSWRRWLPTALVEIGWMVRLYLIDQAWRRSPVSVGAGRAQTPVVLVHGFLCNGSVWHALANRLNAAGRAFVAVSLQPSYRHFQRQLEDLDAAVRAFCAHTGTERVLLLGHSMGGLLVRAYAEQHPHRCAGVICVAAPHHGTFLADLIHGVEGGPPSARCRWLQQFNTRSREHIGVPALNLWSADDSIVIPAWSARLAATPERELSGHGHMALIATTAACSTLLAALDGMDSPGEQTG